MAWKCWCNILASTSTMDKLQQEESKDRIKIWGIDKYTPVRFRLAKVHITKKTEGINI